MNEAEYIEKRVEEQAEWHSKKATKYKKLYYSFMITSIVVSAMIPVVSLLVDYCSYLNIVVALMGAIVSIISGIVSLTQYYSNWMKYRITSEQLKRNLYLYETKMKPFNEENRFEILVEITENIIMENNDTWYRIQSESNNNQQRSENDVGVQNS